MAFVDLREFISALEKSGELCIVKKQASPRDELAAVIERTIARRGPVLMFDNVEGSTMLRRQGGGRDTLCHHVTGPQGGGEGARRVRRA